MSSTALPSVGEIETSQTLGCVLRRAANKKPTADIDGDSDRDSSFYLPCPPGLTSPEESFSNMRCAFRPFQRSRDAIVIQIQELEHQRSVGRPGNVANLPPILGAAPPSDSEQPAPASETTPSVSLNGIECDQKASEGDATWARECQAFGPVEPACEPTMEVVPRARSRYHSLAARRENLMIRHTFDASVLNKATSHLDLDDNDTLADDGLEMSTIDEAPKKYVRAATFNGTFDIFGESAEIEREAYEVERSRAAQAKSEATLPLWQSCRSSAPLGDESSESDAASEADSDLPAHDGNVAGMAVRAESPPETPPERRMPERLKQSRIRIMRSQGAEEASSASQR